MNSFNFHPISVNIISNLKLNYFDAIHLWVHFLGALQLSSYDEFYA